MQRPRLSIDIRPDLGKNPARDEASTLGPRSDNRARWLKFADCALDPHGATEEDIAELTNLARDEQETIKSRIERTARSEETEQIEALRFSVCHTSGSGERLHGYTDHRYFQVTTL